MEFAFWLCVLALGYVFVGYPLLARVLSLLVGSDPQRGPVQPRITVVITAFNEEKAIGAKLDNVLGLSYPPELVSVLVVSDGSTDGTDEIVQAYPDPRVRLLRVDGRRGKTACQNEAVVNSVSDVIVFTDATTQIDGQALTVMAEYFADPLVGCVAGSLVYLEKGSNLTAAGGTAYWGYELALRLAESRLGSMIGVSGCLYAVRRNAYRPIPPNLISDFVVALRMREHGFRTILARDAICYEDTLEQTSDELSMRVRVAVRSIASLVVERRLLNPFRWGLFSWQLWSHKVLRYASPFLWIGALTTSLMLAETRPYLFLFIAQLALLLAGVLGYILHGRLRSVRVLSAPYYFLLTNLSSLIATVKYLRGERMITWDPLRN